MSPRALSAFIFAAILSVATLSSASRAFSPSPLQPPTASFVDVQEKCIATGTRCEPDGEAGCESTTATACVNEGVCVYDLCTKSGSKYECRSPYNVYCDDVVEPIDCGKEQIGECGWVPLIDVCLCVDIMETSFDCDDFVNECANP